MLLISSLTRTETGFPDKFVAQAAANAGWADSPGDGSTTTTDTVNMPFANVLDYLHISQSRPILIASNQD